MNASELAQAMLEWEQKRNDLDELESAIKDAVLSIGKTQTVGNVRASYSKGRNKSHYDAAWFEQGMAHPEIDIEEYQKPIQYDYRAACHDANIDMGMYTEQVSGPTVSVKLVG